MGDKFAGLSIILMFIIFLMFAFGFFYLYVGLEGDVASLEIPVESKVLGINTGPRINSNFKEPEDVTYRTDSIGYDELYDDIQDSKNPKAYYLVSIPKIDLVSEVEHTNSTEIFESDGWILLPWSYQYQDSWFRLPPWKERKPKTEAIILCYRRFYGPRHERSCYNLHLLTKGDEIIFNEYVYSIKNIIVTEKDQNTIFDTSNENEFLKIITNSGPEKEPDQNTNHLVIIAEKVKSIE
ncbi:hypothetical protein GF362_02480 [Candidatus Dojkabacteria bacterium]|nr:hypothetical protein [Candidatus Dojkabacteria bacterium]